MASVALIGPDGAGKTTIAQMLLESQALPFRYIYMGVSHEACNVSLTQTRIFRFLRTWKAREGKSNKKAAGHDDSSARSRSGIIRLARDLAHLAFWVVEEWYRQLVSWHYQRQGHVVLYDRHFVHDFASRNDCEDGESLTKRLHRWLLEQFYPRPDLVICLDAPADVLFARKAEWTVRLLETRRRRLLSLPRRKLPNFVHLNANRPVEAVFADVLSEITNYFSASDAASLGGATKELPEGKSLLTAFRE